jgi:hypothetical protein
MVNISKTLTQSCKMEVNFPSVEYDSQYLMDRDIFVFKFRTYFDGDKYGFMLKFTEELSDFSSSDFFDLALRAFMAEVIVPLVLGKDEIAEKYLIKEGTKYEEFGGDLSKYLTEEEQQEAFENIVSALSEVDCCDCES